MFFSQHKFFWKLRSFLSKAYFWIGTKSFNSRHIAREKRYSLFGLRHLFQITQMQLVLALILSILLQLINPQVIEFYEFTIFKIPDDGDYVSFLLTISGIGGAFIGLYYAAISTIAGSIYAKVPNNIRDLLAQERVGNVYMHLLSFITFFGISLVAFRVLGFERIQIAIPVMLVGAGVGIIAFVKLGQRVFYLFDPTALSYNLFNKLKQFLNMVVAGEYRWNDSAFQKHTNKLASSSLDTLKTLAEITRNEVHLRGTPYISMCKELIKFLLYYEDMKNQIPSNSQWYEQKYVHKNWYQSDDSSVSIAHETGTFLGPEIENDKEWIEERVIVIIDNCLEINLTEERYNEVLELINYIEVYLKLVASNGQVPRVMKIMENLGHSILNILSQESEKPLLTNEVLEKLAVIERFASIPINIAIACGEQVNTVDPQSIENKLNRVRWNKDSNIYKHGFPLYCLPRLEWFKPRIEFEVLTEGRKITPIWYQKELILQIETDTLVQNVEALIYKGMELYKSWIEKTTKTKHPWLAGSVISREWEFWHKVNNQLKIFSNVWSKCSQGRNVKGLPWSTFDSEKLEQESKLRENELMELMSKQSLMLSFLKRPEGFPDYAGQFLHTSGEAIFEAIINNNQNLLRSVFPTYLYGCLMSFDKLRPQTISMDLHTQRNFKIAAAPLLDLMELSGYAKLMADYYDDEQLWSVVVGVWDEYLTKGSKKNPLPLLASSVAITEHSFELAHRSVLRTNWEIRINRKLSDVARHEASSGQFGFTHTVIDHESALIRIFAREKHGSLFDGIDIFITYYLRIKEVGEELDFGRKRRNLQQSLDREEEGKE